MLYFLVWIIVDETPFTLFIIFPVQHTALCIILYSVYIQGVPLNMIVALRLQSRLWFLNLLVTFRRQPNLNIWFLNINHAIHSLSITKMWSAFLMLSIYYLRYWEFHSDFNFIKKKNCRNLKEILYFSELLKAKKKTDYIWD